MKHIAQFQITDSDYVIIETVEEGRQGVVAAGRPGELVEKAQVSLEEALHHVLPALKRVTSTLRGLQPDEFEIEFGIKFNTQVGAMIAAVASEANLTVTVKWNKEMREPIRTS